MSRTHIPRYAADYPEVAETLAQARLPFYCCNCQRKRETTYVTPNFGPFCDECLKELADPERLIAQAHAISRQLETIGVGSCTLTEGVTKVVQRVEELETEITRAKEACPVIRQERWLGKPLIELIEEEVNQIFRMQARAEKAEAELERLRMTTVSGTIQQVLDELRELPRRVRDEMSKLQR